MTSPQSARPPSAATVPAPRPAAEPSRTVTTGQVAAAILQVRERPGRCASEQVRAVLQALDLTVVPDR